MKWIISMLLFISVIGCTDSQQIPDGIIGKREMEKILWDMVQADRYVNYYIVNKIDSTIDKKKESAIFYERVFQMNGITRQEFIKSYKFYLGRPDITKVLFDSIAARAERRKSEVYVNKKNPFLEKRDSLRRRDSILQADSLRRIDSINQVDTASTSELSDSALRELLYK